MAWLTRCLCLLVATTVGCAGTPRTPPPPAGGAPREPQVLEGQDPVLPAFLFSDGGQRFALYWATADGSMAKPHKTGPLVLVFADGRHLGSLAAKAGLDHAACLAQTDGAALLAERLRALTAGQPDPLAQPAASPELTVGHLLCPESSNASQAAAGTPAGSGPADTNSTWQQGLAYAVGIPVLIFVGVWTAIIWVPAAIGMMAYEPVKNRNILRAQQQLALGMPGADVESLMGKPSRSMIIEPAVTEVRYFNRGDRPRELWVGLRDDRLVWLRHAAPDAWLARLADEAASGGGVVRFERPAPVLPAD